MRAINHALTGTAIGIIVNDPVIALPAAFVSHFVCDAIPHYGSDLPKDEVLRSAWFRRQLYIDALLCAVLVLLIIFYKPHNWAIAVMCAFLATLPDFFSMPKYIRARKHQKASKPNAYTRFASNIQWFEHPIGAVVEVAWLIALIILIVPFFTNR